MDELLLQGVYAATVLLGVLLYNYVGYLKFGKANGEKYDVTKLLQTLVTGGIIPVLTSVLIFAQDGLQLYHLITSFTLGTAFSAGMDQLSKVAEKPNQQTP